MTDMAINITIPNPQDICTKCHRSWERLLLLAVLNDLVASISPSPVDCEHKFAEKEPTND